MVLFFTPEACCLGAAENPRALALNASCWMHVYLIYMSRQQRLAILFGTHFLPGGFHAAAGLPAALGQALQASRVPRVYPRSTRFFRSKPP